jgi:hypothetical protein
MKNTSKKKATKNMTGMMKKAACLLALAMTVAMPAKAQIYLDDEDMGENRATWLDGVGNIIPLHEVDWDQAAYAPLGNGILLVGLLGGAYLVNRKRKQEE